MPYSPLRGFIQISVETASNKHNRGQGRQKTRPIIALFVNIIEFKCSVHLLIGFVRVYHLF